jgi:protein-disulfide isomerase
MRTPIGLLVAVLLALASAACRESSPKAGSGTPTLNPCGAPGSTRSCGDIATDATVAATTAAGTPQLTMQSFDGIPQDGQTLGSSDAPLKIDLYQNFLCPHCRDFALSVLPQLITDYVKPGKVSITFHDTALGNSASAENAHGAARCAADQGKFWPAYAVLYQHYSDGDATYAKANLESLLAQTGVDATKLAACLDADQHKAEVDASTDAFTSMGDNNPDYANELATVTAQGGPAIPLVVVAGTYLTAPEGYAPIRAAIRAKLGQ